MATAAKKARAPAHKDSKTSGQKKILAVDIGGTSIKILATGQTEPRKLPSSSELAPGQMVQAVLKLAKDWDFDAVSIGYPGLVGDNGPRSEPGNLGSGWVGFNYAAAFGRPVKIVNDAAMQALGSYEGGRMLFLGLGTGLGSTLIADNVVLPLELGRLRYDGKASFMDMVGKHGLQRLGKKAWRKAVVEIASRLADALIADTVVLGGGNAKELGVMPHGMRIGGNQTAFRGGFRLWHLSDIRTHSAKTEHRDGSPTEPGEWRVL